MIRKILVGATAGLMYWAGAIFPATAAELLSGAQIVERLAGNTLEGRRLDGGEFVEFYSMGGRVLAEDYEAIWHVNDDQLCFQPASFRTGERDLGECYRLSLAGEELQWLDPDGKLEGYAQVVPGNAFGF